MVIELRAHISIAHGCNIQLELHTIKSVWYLFYIMEIYLDNFHMNTETSTLFMNIFGLYLDIIILSTSKMKFKQILINAKMRWSNRNFFSNNTLQCERSDEKTKPDRICPCIALFCFNHKLCFRIEISTNDHLVYVEILVLQWLNAHSTYITDKLYSQKWDFFMKCRRFWKNFVIIRALGNIYSYVEFIYFSTLRLFGTFWHLRNKNIVVPLKRTLVSSISLRSIDSHTSNDAYYKHIP